MLEYVGEKGNVLWLEHFAFRRESNRLFSATKSLGGKRSQGLRMFFVFGLGNFSLIIK